MKQKINKKKESVQKPSTANSLKDLQHEELSGQSPKDTSIAVSQTDEDEDEGLGDGNIGRSREDPFSK